MGRRSGAGGPLWARFTFCALCCFAFCLPRSASAQNGILFRINCGGNAFVDKAQHVWEADAHFSGGAARKTDSAILNTDMPVLYQSDRTNDTGKAPLEYVFPARAGDYHIYLHYAESDPAALGVGKRVFDVAVNGVIVAMDMDIFAQVGGKTPLVLDYLASSVGGKIAITLANKKGAAKISGIEILPQTPFHAKAAPYRINCGGQDYVDSSGNYWEADGHYSRGSVFATAAAIAKTGMPLIYRSERWNDTGAFVYSFDAADGNYAVRLHFAEIYFQAAGKRIFSVDLNGSEVLKNLDIAAEASPNTALVKEFTARPIAGKITIALRNGVGNPKISAIEILPAVPAGMPSGMGAAGGDPIGGGGARAQTVVIKAAGHGTVSVLCRQGSAFSVSLRDCRGAHVAAWIGTGARSYSGLAPGEYVAEAHAEGRTSVRRIRIP